MLAIVATVNLGLAAAVFIRNKRNAANRTFAIAVVAIVVWLSAAYLSDQVALREYAVVFNRLAFGTAVALGGLLLYFLRLFPTPATEHRARFRAYFAFSAVIGMMTVFTPLMISGVAFEPWGTNIVPGPLFQLMLVHILLGALALLWVSRSRERIADGRSKIQLNYVLVGLVLFVVTSVFFGLLLPMLTGSYRLSSLNTFSTLFLVGFTAYAMMKHRFMDVRFVVIRSLVYSALVFAFSVALVVIAMVTRARIASEFGVQSDTVFVVTCLVAVLIFQPLRDLLDQYTDAVFFRKTYDPQKLVTQLGRAMTSTLDLQALATVLAFELAKGMRLQHAAVAYTRADTVEVVGAGCQMTPEQAQRVVLASYTGRIVHEDDFDSDSVTASILRGCSMRVLVPLASDGVVIAVIMLGPKLSGEVFTSNDDSFLEILSDEASIGMKNAHLFDERNQRVRELSALNTMSSALGREMVLDSVLERALRQVMKVTHADCGSIMLMDDASQTLTIKAADGLPADVVETTCTRIGEGIAGWVAQHRKALVLVNAADSGFGVELARDGVRAALCVPLVHKGRITGVLNISRRRSGEAFSRENLKVVTAFAGQLAVAIENARLYEDLESTFIGTIGALAAAVDAKDPYTFGHSSDVTQYSLAIAAELCVPDAETERLRIAALLHDIGKIGIDSSILNKPGTLTDEEYAIIKSHPDIAANILGTLDFLEDVVPLVQHHHEYFDGGGYPAGIAGEAIPLGARIISVADAFNAMTSDRPYRAALSRETALAELKRNAGTQFDPKVVEAFEGIILRTVQLDLRVETQRAS